MNTNCGPLRIRAPDQMLETGHVVNGHLHNFDHVTIILAGRFLVEKTKKDGSKTSIEIEGGFPSSRILIEKDAWHRLTVLRGPACYMCVYPTDQKTVKFLRFTLVGKKPTIYRRKIK
jgi:hypothetical protein